MIKIDDRYSIEVDADCYTARFDRGYTITDSKTGEEKASIETLGYYGTLDRAVYACRKDAIKKRLKSRDYTLKEAIAEIKAVTRRFEDALRNEVGDA